MGKTLERDGPVRALPRRFAASGNVVAGQIGSDLRESADAVRTAFDDALRRLHESDRESAVTALVGRIAWRFESIDRDIRNLAASLDPTPARLEPG
jgi:hypothetical protein